MLDKRDPKNSPKTGDVFVKGNRERKILRIYSYSGKDMVHYQCVFGGNSKNVTIRTWRAWSLQKGVEVVHKAGE